MTSDFTLTTLRPAVAKDLPQLKRVYAAASGANLDETFCNRLIRARGLCVAERDNRVIGFVGLDLDAETPLKWLYVSPDFQGQGVGSRLLDVSESTAWQFGLNSLRTHAAPDAVQFYLKQDYHEVPDDEKFRHEHDGVEMEKPRPENARMLYMVIEKFKDRNAEAVYARYREKGRMLPEGLIYKSSWVEPNFDRCFQLMECSDPNLFDQWIANWNDLVEFEIVEVRPSPLASHSL